MFARMLKAAVAAVGMLVAGCGVALAEKRVALVIGNASYAKVDRLANTVNDASDVSASLTRLGFTVTRLDNAAFDAMRRGLRDFSRLAAGADMAMVYFAGHGMEMGGENYLIPVDAELARDTDIEHEAITLKSVMATVEGARQLGLVVLDACRNNPFAAKMVKSGNATRSIGRGLARVEPTGSVLVAFAAKEGTTAADGQGRNSPFTTSLLKHIETADLEISFLFRNVRDDVVQATARVQEPFVYGSLSRNAIFLKKGAPVVASATPPAPAPKPLGPLFTGDPGEACDRAATYPEDTRRNRNVTPVPAAKVDGELTVAACTAAMERNPAQTRFAFQLARGYFALGNLDQGIEFASRAARLGHGSAACTIGEMHSSRRLLRNVDEYAVRWFEIGAELGEYECAHNLAFHYFNGRGVVANSSKGVALLRQAIAQNYVLSHAMLGEILVSGAGGVRRDVAEARRLFEVAAAQGHPQSIGFLSKLLREVAPGEVRRSATLVLAAFRAGDANARDALTERFDAQLDPQWRLAIEQELARAGHLRRQPGTAFDAETQAALQRFLLAK
jgi:TPR repeat protein